MLLRKFNGSCILISSTDRSLCDRNLFIKKKKKEILFPVRRKGYGYNKWRKRHENEPGWKMGLEGASLL